VIEALIFEQSKAFRRN